ncbi:MAG: hypothetical protein WKF86_00975 [Acidimicrobiales bacterium]
MPKRPVMVAVGLALLGAIVIIFAGGNGLILLVGMFLVLSAGGIGLKLGLDWWKATE